MTRLLVLILAICLGGCATRGTLDFDCPHFDTAINGQRPFRTVLPASELERTIRGESITAEQHLQTNEAARDEQAQIAAQARADARGVVALLLSGGGQWGAFGAGFMSRLLQDGHFPEHLGLVTGVSTGGLQSLFVGAGLSRALPFQRNWAARAMVPHSPANYADLMRYEYRPNRESEIANRNPQMMSIVTGSMAGLQPLREVIENALCADPDAPTGRCMIDDLATSPILTLIGFVDAEDGNFYYVNVNRIARSAPFRPALGRRPPARAQDGGADRIDPPLSRRQARECITAAALASVAMPAFFQQVRVNRRTYYDGGVRRSVFADYAAELAQRANKEAAVAANGAKPQPARVYVLRNGPTSVPPDEASNRDRRIVVDSALRAERIVVNELEVGSVAGLRLDYPVGPLFFRSADDWEQFLYHDQALGSRTCRQRKGDGVMFDPDFMRCIMDYGILAGGQEQMPGAPPGWRILPELPASIPKPAADGAPSGTGTKPPAG